MWRRLFEPMECDRACRVRVYVSWALLIGWIVLFMSLIPFAHRNGWIPVAPRDSGGLIIGVVCISSALMAVPLCRSQAAYYIWRQSNTSPVGQVIQALTPKGMQQKKMSFQQAVVRVLLAAVAFMTIGIMVLIKELG